MQYGVKRLWWAYAALAILIGMSIGAFWGLIWVSDPNAEPTNAPLFTHLSDPYLQRIIIFSLKQAALSALLSVILAWPIARALYYSPILYARSAFLSLCLLSFVMPTLVLITGLVVLLGRSGWLTPWLGEGWNLYGLHGILLAHVYLNLPLAVRVLYQQLQHIPASSWQLAVQLKLTAWQGFRVVEWPMLRGVLFALSALIFILCFNSFAVVLALGGGPQATTLEVAIYQALKYDFNITEALLLAWVQLGITGSIWLIAQRGNRLAWLSADIAKAAFRPIPSIGWQRGYYLLYGSVWLLWLLPLIALLANVITLDASRWQNIHLWRPFWVSIGLALCTAMLSLSFAYAILWPVRRWRHSGYAVLWIGLATHHLLIPTMVLSVGWYVLLLRYWDLESGGMLMVIVLNTSVTIPFAVQQLRPRVNQFDAQYQALCQSLKLTPWQRWQVEWPYLRSSLIMAGTLVLLLALGDVAVFALFGNEDWITLPWLIYRYAGSYRLAEAAVVASVLLLLCAVLLAALQRMQRHAEY